MITSMWRDGRSVSVSLCSADWRALRPGHTQAASQQKNHVAARMPFCLAITSSTWGGAHFDLHRRSPWHPCVKPPRPWICCFLLATCRKRLRLYCERWLLSQPRSCMMKRQSTCCVQMIGYCPFTSSPETAQNQKSNAQTARVSNSMRGLCPAGISGPLAVCTPTAAEPRRWLPSLTRSGMTNSILLTPDQDTRWFCVREKSISPRTTDVGRS